MPLLLPVQYCRRWVVTQFEFFSVQTLRSLCLCGSFLRGILNHRDTENAELSQRKPKLVHYRASRLLALRSSLLFSLDGKGIKGARRVFGYAHGGLREQSLSCFVEFVCDLRI